MLAVEANSPAMIKWVLERGANAQAAMASGWRAVHLAVRLGHESCLLMLLQEVRSSVWVCGLVGVATWWCFFVVYLGERNPTGGAAACAAAPAAC
jgi:uncharacterized MAPEG superfamily protein